MSAIERPVWLSDEGELLALLHAALDRFDRQPAEDRRRSIDLAAEKFLTALARADASADQTWALVRELERKGLLSIRAAKRSPYDLEWQGAKLAFAPATETTLREWLQRERVEPAMLVWRRAVERLAHRFPHAIDAVLTRRIVIAQRTADEVVAALASIGEVAGPVTLRQLSSFAFWGDSKVLDDRGDLVAALFPQLEIRDRAIVVAVYLPLACTGVLFIENQDTYVEATDGRPEQAQQQALVYVAGFRGAASRIRSRAGARLHFGGAGVERWKAQFEQWWFDEGTALGPSGFWGDLDFAGMQILKSLRERFGGLTAWQPGYGPMLIRLQQSPGRTAAQNDRQAQVDPGMTGCDYADTVLLPAIRQFGYLDQERMPA